jgi:mRNA-degrading endonuclease RelE of RelBE toxin-antitoxin system
MKALKTKAFQKAFESLPTSEQAIFKQQEIRFLADANDGRLHVKKMRGLKDVFTFRVTRRYRVFFYWQNKSTAILFDIDHRKDAYK